MREGKEWKEHSYSSMQGGNPRRRICNIKKEANVESTPSTSTDSERRLKSCPLREHTLTEGKKEKETGKEQTHKLYRKRNVSSGSHSLPSRIFFFTKTNVTCSRPQYGRARQLCADGRGGTKRTAWWDIEQKVMQEHPKLFVTLTPPKKVQQAFTFSLETRKKSTQIPHSRKWNLSMLARSRQAESCTWINLINKSNTLQSKKKLYNSAR